MTILIDMDDVLELLVEAVVRHVNDLYGTHATAADVTEWDLSKAFPTLTHEQVYATVDDSGLWDIVQPMPGGPEAVQQLMAEGHDVFVVTASNYGNIAKKMRDVLFRYYPFLSWDQVILTRRKQMIRGDVLVDDGVHNLVGGEYRKILFDANHNRSFDEASIGAVRVHNWTECLQELHRIADELASVQG